MIQQRLQMSDSNASLFVPSTVKRAKIIQQTLFSRNPAINLPHSVCETICDFSVGCRIRNFKFSHLLRIIILLQAISCICGSPLTEVVRPTKDWSSTSGANCTQCGKILDYDETIFRCPKNQIVQEHGTTQREENQEVDFCSCDEEMFVFHLDLLIPLYITY